MRSTRATAIALFATAWLVYTVHWSAYIVREHYPAISLAEQGTLDVSAFLDVNVDIFRGPKGGAYINNNPGASIAGALPIALARPLLRRIERMNARRPPPRVDPKLDAVVLWKAVGQHREWYFLAVAFLTVAGLMAPATALAVAATYLVLVRTAELPNRVALAAAAILAVGTPFFLRTGYLSHNLLVAVAALWGFVLLVGQGVSGGLSKPRLLGAGLLSGFALLCDYTGVLVIAALGAYLWIRVEGPGGLRSRLAWSGWFGLGVLPGAIALLAYQAMAFGAPALPSQHFMQPIEQTAHGYRGFGWPSLTIAWSNFFDPEYGLFFYCPLLMLAIAAPFVRQVPYRLPLREQWFLLGYAGVFVLFCAANRYSVLQWTTNVRYLVPIVPALLVLSLQVAQALPRVVTVGLIALSVAINWLVSIGRDRFAVFTGDGLQFSWARRMAELDILEQPRLVTAAGLVVTLAVVYAVWRRELTCAS
jgi:hypothetical protein